jgi:prophage regulatory protein
MSYLSDAHSDIRLLNLRQVQAKIGGITRTTIWRWVRAGQFPAPVALGAQRIAWREDVIDKWIATRPIAAAHAGHAARAAMAATSSK